MEAKDLTSILAVLTNVQTLIAFIAFIVPGFVSLRVYEALRGGESRKINEAIIDVVIYSFATDIVWVPILLSSVVGPPLRLIVLSVVGFVVFPGLLGYAWFWLQGRLAKSGVIADPTAKPWDKFFQRIAKEKLQVGIIVTLSDGTKLGGRYVDPGFVSSYPADEQLHVGETWKLDKSGGFVKRINGSFGFLVDKKDCAIVEFFNWDDVEATLPEVEESSDGQQIAKVDTAAENREGLPGAPKR